MFTKGDPDGQPHPIVQRFCEHNRTVRIAQQKRTCELVQKGLQLEKIMRLSLMRRIYVILKGE